VARLVRDGAVGEPRAARAVFSFALDRPDDPRWDLALGGGSIMDVGCYAVSALRLLCGEPERVSCETVMRGEVDARASAVLRFPGDVLGVAECGFDAAREGIEVTGTAGRIVVETPWFSPRAELVRPDGTREPIEAARVNPYAAEVADLTRAIAGGGTPRLGREDALGQARTIEALYRSAAEGRPVAVGAA
jgi:predicted dehydrogenase